MFSNENFWSSLFLCYFINMKHISDFSSDPNNRNICCHWVLGRVSSKNKQHLAAHNISLRFWSIFVTSLLLEVISSFLYVLLHYSYWTFNLLKNKKTKQNKKNYSPGLFTVMYLISNFSKKVFFFLRKN